MVNIDGSFGVTNVYDGVLSYDESYGRSADLFAVNGDDGDNNLISGVDGSLVSGDVFADDVCPDCDVDVFNLI